MILYQQTNKSMSGGQGVAKALSAYDGVTTARQLEWWYTICLSSLQLIPIHHGSLNYNACDAALKSGRAKMGSWCDYLPKKRPQTTRKDFGSNYYIGLDTWRAIGCRLDLPITHEDTFTTSPISSDRPLQTFGPSRHARCQRCLGGKCERFWKAMLMP